MNMKEYLPFEQALEMKELGFNEDAFGYLAIEGTSVQLPLYQQAFRFFFYFNEVFAPDATV
jgi:hypothetical protein